MIENYETDDDQQARVFYKYVMGGGGFDIHYGIFRKPTDTVYEASKATNDRLLTCMDWTLPVTKDSVVLDLGSGHGGISHEVCVLLWNLECCLNFGHFCRRPVPNYQNDVVCAHINFFNYFDFVHGFINFGMHRCFDF